MKFFVAFNVCVWIAGLLVVLAAPSTSWLIVGAFYAGFFAGIALVLDSQRKKSS